MLDYFYCLYKHFLCFYKDITFNAIVLRKNTLDLLLVKSLTFSLLGFIIVFLNQLLALNFFSGCLSLYNNNLANLICTRFEKI